MSGNGENEPEGDEEVEPKKETGKQLRDKLENALTENTGLKAQLAIHEAGLSHLSEKQRRAVVRDLQDDEKEVTADNLKAAAKDLGYPESAAKPKDEGGGEDEEPPGRNDPAEEALNSLDAIEQARRQAIPDTDPGSFEAKVKAAKSQDEVVALVRNEGHKVGVVHEWDME